MDAVYLEPTYFIDSDHPRIIAFSEAITKDRITEREKVIALFNAVRDGLFYNPYYLDFRKEALVASAICNKRTAYCIEKAILLCACLRATKIPARLNFGNVRNHIAVDRLTEVLKTDVLVFHGCTEVFLDDKWIKITPAFNKSLCNKLDVPVLEFDGYTDAVFQQFDNDGRTFMEYLHSYGSFADMPYELSLSEITKHYPHLPIPDNLIWDFTN
ncbi:transglutaminase-like domain-containing protein [Spongiimicrobium sp. 3-5]|uniref:transglutaminase-like domain-containing protein n=1 Tax=Spongiimicrobium sp. 3-5 TaxID=3332596 RepID=UPI00397F1235